MKLHLHPDGLVYVRDENDEVVYAAAVAQFELDYGTSLPPLPEAMRSFVYDQESKVMTYFDRKQNAYPVEGVFEWQFGEAVIGQAAELVQVSEARETAALKVAPAPVSTMPVTGA